MTSTETFTLNIPREAVRRDAKTWAKTLTGVDEAQHNGYRLLGEFVGAQATLREGDWIVTYGSVISQRGRVNGHDWTLYRVVDGALAVIADGRSPDMSWVEEATAVFTRTTEEEARDIANDKLSAVLTEMTEEDALSEVYHSLKTTSDATVADALSLIERVAAERGVSL